MDDTISQKYCRVCTNKKTHMMSIFEHYDFFLCNLQVCEVITKCASVQIRKLDGFPEQICSECLEHLRQAFSFKQLCEDSDYEFRHNLVTDRIVSKDAYCEEVTKIECCDDNDNIFNEELHSASCDDGFEIRNEFCEGETNIQYGILGNRLVEENVTTSTTDSTLQNLDEDVSEVSNTCCTKVKEEINGNNDKEVVTTVEQLEIKLDCYEEDTKVVFGDLAMLHEENAKNSTTSTLQTLNDELSACSSRANSEEIIENEVSDKHLQEGDIGKSSTDSITLEDVNKDLSAKTTTIERSQICEITVNLDQISEDTEISSNELCNEVNTNISKDVGSATKSDFTKRTKHCGILNKQLLQEGTVKKSSTDLNRSHNLNDALGPTIIHNENSHICKFFRLCLNETETLNNHREIDKEKECYKCKICGKYYTCKAAIIKLGIPIRTGCKPYKRGICNTSSSRIDSLNRHSKDKPYKCKICDENFQSKIGLVYHIRIHTGEKPYKCQTCRECFSRKDLLKQHMRIHTGEMPHKCETCGKCFSRKDLLNQHMRIHTGGKTYKCETCSKSFSRKDLLNQHMRIHTGEKPHKCETCTKCFSKKFHLNRHMRIHTGEKPHKCETCSDCFSQKVFLNQHMRIHTGEKPHKCETCSKCFSKKFHLSRHMRIHTGEKPYKCKTCRKCFSLKDLLNQHMRIHTGEKPYKCETCSKCFSRKDLLNRHMRIHTGDKPYKCETCRKCFSLKDLLIQHMRIHTGEKPHKCETCSKCFSKKFHLNRHMRIHTGEKPHKCETCSECFSQKEHLNQHMRIHTGEKPHKCETCSECFSQKEHLNQHMRIHTGEKPYKCETCSKCFSRKDLLNQHMRIHTGEMPHK